MAGTIYTTKNKQTGVEKMNENGLCNCAGQNDKPGICETTHTISKVLGEAYGRASHIRETLTGIVPEASASPAPENLYMEINEILYAAGCITEVLAEIEQALI